MARFEFDGIDDAIKGLNDLDKEPLNCVCPACGKNFKMLEKDLIKPTVTCPHCGAELDEV